MEKNKIWKYIVMIFLTVLLVFGEDTNQKQVMEAPVEDTEWGYSEQGDLTKTIFLEAFGKGYYKGEFTLDAGEDAEWKLLDMTRNSGENKLGFEVASGEIKQGTSNQQFEFTLQRQTSNLC